MVKICCLVDLPENSTRCFKYGEDDYFLVHKNGNVFCYLNRCPHVGIRLDWIENQLLDSEEELIQCSSHGALFDIESGDCLYGPCRGDKLRSAKITVNEGWIEFKTD